MADHISSIRESGIRQVTKEQFYAELVWGDLVFCQGNYTISKGIEAVTGSPFSHVFQVWLPEGADQWLTIESTIQRGVHIGKLADYMDGYDGDLMLARRPALSWAQKLAILNAGFNVLEDAYDWQQEVSIVGHKLVAALPVVKPKSEYYCSGLQYLMSLATTPSLQMPGPNLPTPEDNWRDPSVVPVCARLQG